jgi:hypothetical protein
MSTPINVIIDNKTVLNDLVSVGVTQQEGAYCNSVSLSLKSKTFWDLCDPTTDFGTLRIKVVIGSDAYEFLIEERDTTSVSPGVNFTVWGRSKQALLSKPYSKTINDTGSTSHPWQSGTTSASAIISYVLSNYCDYAVTVDWTVENFAVYADSFSVSNQSPIEVISSLAAVVGAELMANMDGSLSINAYSVAEGAAVESYNDLDDIVSLSESADYPSGYNAVTIYGYDPGGGGGSSVSATITAERYGSTGDIYPRRDHTVRVYYYTKNAPILNSAESGDCKFKGSGVESITEDVTLIFGKGNTSKTNTVGKTEVTGGDVNTPIEVKNVTYNVLYRDYTVSSSVVGTSKVMFYTSDKAAYTVYSYTVEEEDDAEPGGAVIDTCSGISVEEASGETITPGDNVLIRVFGQKPSGAFSDADKPTFTKEDIEIIEDEDVTFKNGVASVSSPIAAQVRSGDLGWQSVVIKYEGINSTQHPTYADGSKEITQSSFVDVDAYYNVAASVSYHTQFYEYEVTIPSDWDNEAFLIWFTFTGCSTQDIEITLDPGGNTSTTLNISNYYSSAVIEGVRVVVDDVWVGNSDADGNVAIPKISRGSHSVKVTKEGYLDSDLDDIENSSFVVE